MAELSKGATLYICGPMHRKWRFNFPAFDDADRRLKERGYNTINPAELDRQAGFDPFHLPDDFDWNKMPDGFDLLETFERDIPYVFSCDGLAVLDDWQDSSGACWEIATAKYLGKPIIDERTLLPLFTEPDNFELSESSTTRVSSEQVDETILEEAQRLTSRDRQTTYGHPYEDFSRTAGMWKAYKGVDFTPEDVGMMMILVKVSRERNLSKRDNRTDIAGYAQCVQMITDYRESVS